MIIKYKGLNHRYYFLQCFSNLKNIYKVQYTYTYIMIIFLIMLLKIPHELLIQNLNQIQNFYNIIRQKYSLFDIFSLPTILSYVKTKIKMIKDHL